MKSYAFLVVSTSVSGDVTLNKYNDVTSGVDHRLVLELVTMIIHINLSSGGQHVSCSVYLEIGGITTRIQWLMPQQK